MKVAQLPKVRLLFSVQYGIATRSELLELVTESEIRTALRRGEWALVAKGVYALPTWPNSPWRLLLAASLVTGGVVSHASAAWVWGLLEEAPEEPTVTVYRGHHVKGTARSTLTLPSASSPIKTRVVVRHSTDLAQANVSHWKGVPTTNPLRTLVDLAGEASGDVLDEALDRALVTRLLTLDGVVAEVARLKRRGRSGPAQLEAALARRGFAGAPPASVLEAKLLRLFAAHGVPVLGTQVVVEGGSYRLDTRVGVRVIVETDGYAFHSTPEQKERDEARRNALKLQGWTVLVYGYRAVMRQGARVCAEVLRALEQEREGQLGSLGCFPDVQPGSSPRSA